MPIVDVHETNRILCWSDGEHDACTFSAAPFAQPPQCAKSTAFDVISKSNPSNTRVRRAALVRRHDRPVYEMDVSTNAMTVTELDQQLPINGM
jgi:hypothetical protein